MCKKLPPVSACSSDNSYAGLENDGVVLYDGLDIFLNLLLLYIYPAAINIIKIPNTDIAIIMSLFELITDAILLLFVALEVGEVVALEVWDVVALEVWDVVALEVWDVVALEVGDVVGLVLI